MDRHARISRLRRSPALREMLQETHLRTEDLIMPLLLSPVVEKREEVPSMPGVFRTSIEEMLRDVEWARKQGIRGVLLTGTIPEPYPGIDRPGGEIEGLLPRAIGALKERFGDDVVVFSDALYREWSPYGHCGIFDENGELNAEDTLMNLQRAAVAHAEMGADAIAPSAMLDGMVPHLRQSLDGAGFYETSVLAFAAKYDSAFYTHQQQRFGIATLISKSRGQQLHPGNRREALLEVLTDEAEGADMLMVKPALAYLDVIDEARRRTQRPIVAYSVSGEYSMVHGAAKAGWLAYEPVMMEILLSIKRAGADMIVTHFARDAAEYLRNGSSAE